MLIPLKSDKSVDVTLTGYNNEGTVTVKIFSVGFLKDCDINCWTCTTADRTSCSLCKTGYYLLGTECVT